MRKKRLPDDQSLHDDLLDLLLQLPSIVPHPLEVPKDGSEGPLVPLVIIVLVLVLLKVVIVLVDGIVCQVHVQIVHVEIIRHLVLLGGESCEATLMQVDTQRVHTIKEGIDPQIEFKVVDQVGPLDVALHHATFVFTVFHDALKISCEKDSLALREPLWLDDEGLL